MEIYIFTHKGYTLDFSKVENLAYSGNKLTFTYTGKFTGLVSEATFFDVAGYVVKGGE